MIYPKEAWARFGPGPLLVRDANGKTIRRVHACDPLTGEVIAVLPAEVWMGPLLIALEKPMKAIWQLLWLLGAEQPSGSTAKRHYFAPAPLIISGGGS